VVTQVGSRIRGERYRGVGHAIADQVVDVLIWTLFSVRPTLNASLCTASRGAFRIARTPG
jgi:hypothetical protein